MIEPTLSSLRNSTLKLNFKRHVPMPYMFYCFLVQFDHGVHVLKKKQSFFPGALLGWVPMSLCRYDPIFRYIPMSLCTYVPSLDFKTCRFLNNWWWGDHAPVGILLLYLGLPSSLSQFQHHLHVICCQFIHLIRVRWKWKKAACPLGKLLL